MRSENLIKKSGVNKDQDHSSPGRTEASLPYLSAEHIESLSDEEFIGLAGEVTDKLLGPGSFEEINDITEITKGYEFFTLKYYFNNKYIDTSLVANLKRGASALCIGVGPATLEHVLIAGFQIPKAQITLADIDTFPSNLHTEVYPVVKLNMHDTEDWNKLEEKYDYIMFPESLGPSLSVMKVAEKPNEEAYKLPFYREIHALCSALPYAVTENEYSQTETDEILQEAEAKGLIQYIEQYPGVPYIKRLLDQAFQHLAAGGEIRISGRGASFMGPEERLYTLLYIKKFHPDYILTLGPQWEVCNIKKIKGNK